jgi:hypothetical protein
MCFLACVAFFRKGRLLGHGVSTLIANSVAHNQGTNAIEDSQTRLEPAIGTAERALRRRRAPHRRVRRWVIPRGDLSSLGSSKCNALGASFRVSAIEAVQSTGNTFRPASPIPRDPRPWANLHSAFSFYLGSELLNSASDAGPLSVTCAPASPASRGTSFLPSSSFLYP